MNRDIQAGQHHSETEIIKPVIVVNKDNPLELIYSDGNLSFFKDSTGQAWTFFETQNEFRPSIPFDAHPMHHQDLATAKMPKVSPEQKIKFYNILDAAIYTKKNFYQTRFNQLQSLSAEKRTKLIENPNDAESQEILDLCESEIPEIEQFIQTAASLETQTDEKVKNEIRDACELLLKEIENQADN